MSDDQNERKRLLKRLRHCWVFKPQIFYATHIFIKRHILHILLFKSNNGIDIFDIF